MTGEAFSRVVDRSILTPLGLRDSFYFPAHATPAQRARIAELDRRLPDPSDYRHYDKERVGWRYVSPEGGLYSTAADLRTFMQLFRHRGQIPGKPRILQENSIAKLMRDDLGGKPHNGSATTGRSLGFAVVRALGVRDLPGLSPGTIHHRGRFSTEFWYDPARDEIGIFLYQIVLGNDSTPSRAESDAFKQMLARIP